MDEDPNAETFLLNLDNHPSPIADLIDEDYDALVLSTMNSFLTYFLWRALVHNESSHTFRPVALWALPRGDRVCPCCMTEYNALREGEEIAAELPVKLACGHIIGG